MAEPDNALPTDDEEPRSIAERAAAGEEPEPPEPPLELGDVQLSMNLGGIVSDRNARKVEENVIVLQGGERPISGLLDIDTDYQLLVTVRPDPPAPKAKRDETGKTRAFKLRQTSQIRTVRRADTADALRDLFADLLGREPKEAAALLDELREFVAQDLAA